MRPKDIREPPSTEQCDKAWAEGYIDGFAFAKGAVPKVPVRPTMPDGISDPVRYYRNLGREHGARDALTAKS